MYCPRLDHFRRITANGKIGVCGHMINSPTFDDLEELESSKALADIKSQMKEGHWPEACQRCNQEEKLGQKSIRMHAIDRHHLLVNVKPDYLVLGGILDNICNAACHFCNESLSTKIGSLMHGANYKKVDNSALLEKLPVDRIVELDINGGEPSNSPAYKKLLEDPPPNVKIIRINTNASKFIDSVPKLLDKGIKVIVTASLDGTGKIYEYARWPLKWDKFNDVINQYKRIDDSHALFSIDFWTTLSAYTVGDLDNIDAYSKQMGIPLSVGRLKTPAPLDVRYTNPLTKNSKHLPDVAIDRDNTQELLDYIKQQDKLRGTNYEDCYNWS